MQVCTQPQICDERPHWELRPYLTHGEPPPALSPSLSLSLFPFSFQRGGGCHTEEGYNEQGREWVTTKEEERSERVTERRERERETIRNREWRGSGVECLLMQEDTPEHPDPWHKYDTPAANHCPPPLPETPPISPPPLHKLQHYHMYGSPSPLIMLITCPAPAAPKMGVFSSRLAPNAASPGLEVYIHTLLNGQILPRCCLHSGPTHPFQPPPPHKKKSYSLPMDSQSSGKSSRGGKICVFVACACMCAVVQLKIPKTSAN